MDSGSSSPTTTFTTFNITKAASPAKLPAPQARMSSIEFSFRGPGTLHNGDLVRFGNDGFLVYMIVAARGASLAGAQKIAKLLKTGKDRQAQQLATGFNAFVNILTHGAFQQQVVHIRPGFWVLACLFDTQDHREHTTLGMERVIHITNKAAHHRNARAAARLFGTGHRPLAEATGPATLTGLGRAGPPLASRGPAIPRHTGQHGRRRAGFPVSR